MMFPIFSRFRFWALALALACAAASSPAALDVRSRDPYYGAVVIDAATGAILKEDHASAVAYPASMVKLMNLYIILDDLEAGKLRLDEAVTVSRDVSKVGGRQVWLRENEVVQLEELLYAMVVHSANDAAAALAIRASGSREAHAARMNAKAQALGLRNTVFHNVHGLPPSKDQQPDMTSALDMARLARALLADHPEALKYTAVTTRPFRETNPVQLTSSNKLLGRVSGCDGLKTGYFFAGGFSTTVTAERDGRRVIAVVLGSKEAKVRDAKAAELLETGFIKLPPLPPPPPVDTNEVPVEAEVTVGETGGWGAVLPVVIGVVIIGVAAALFLLRRRPRR